jgi:SAM-dependent methyltransferase
MTSGDILLGRGGDPKRPTLEARVAFQWEAPLDTLGYRQATLRDRTILGWLREAVSPASRPAQVLDMGCAYGNHLFMLNAMLGKDPSVTLRGIDLYEGSVEFARAFAARVPGFENCAFQTGDIGGPLPFDDASFDAVNIADVLEHLETPDRVVAEICRVMRPGATLVLSTPQRTTVFKSAAKGLNRLTGGHLYRGYYAGKATNLDEHGQPIMETDAGHDHISEMNLDELTRLLEGEGFDVADVRLMPIMSGSAWFDKHVILLAGLLALEGLHEKLRRPSWAHAVCIRAVKR